jgi:hypothetical protein
MSFYQTNNSSIIRFNVHDPNRKVIAPFQTLARVVQMQKIGQGYSGYYTGAVAGTVGVENKSFLLTPQQLQNGALIISPTGSTTGINPYAFYTLPSAFALQEYLGGRGAFNMLANQTTQQNTGANDYFILNVYNVANCTGVFVAYDNQSQKIIQPAPIFNDAALTPVLVQFNGVNSTYATTNGVANYVSYTLY